MKKILFTLITIFLVSMAEGQVPNKFNYQAVIRNADGTVKSNAAVTMEFRIIDMEAGGISVFEETLFLSTNEFGLINAVIGAQNEIDFSWTDGTYSFEVLVDGNIMGSSPILAVPYALAAAEVANKDDADADPTNELQDLQLVDNVLTITGNPDATPITIASGGGDSQWVLSGDSISITNRNVGIGTSSPKGKLIVMGDGSELADEPLFEVKKSDGQTVFAVYNDGAEIYVNENPAKGIKGGFAVGGYNSTKGTTTDFMRLTPDNYFIGHQSGGKITSGTYNSTLGYQAGTELNTGSENIFIGYQSGYNNSNGYQNTFLGYQSGFQNTSGFQNSFLGYRAGYANTVGHNNLFLGYETGYSNTTGNFNMFLGYRSGTLNTSGQSNMFIGYHAGRLNNTGSRNLFVGPGAGFGNEDGDRNIFIGGMSGYYNKSGSSNLFFGQSAGASNTDGGYNIFIGTTTGGSNTSGHRNIFIGDQAGYRNTIGFQNTIIGYQSGYYLLAGGYNTFMGFEAGYTSNGSENVYIGSKTGRKNRGSNNIFIGAGAGGQVDSISNTLVIDNNFGIAPEDALIYGKLDGIREIKLTARVGIWRTPTANRFEVEGSASKTEAGSWLANSDMRIKTDIQDIENAFDVMLNLHPVKFRYTDEYKAAHPSVKDKYYYNFIAQEYKEVFPEAVQSSGEILESAQDEILQMDSYNAQIYSIKAVQELILENQKQKEQIEELYEMIKQMKEEQ